MKFLHISDLHLGKMLHYYPLLSCQENMLRQVVDYVKKEQPDAVLLCGDIYDKTVPSVEAVRLFDGFLTALTNCKPTPEILLISGNHDSGERLGFAGEILKKQHIHVAGRIPADEAERLSVVELEDAYGTVRFYMLPFLRPGAVRRLENSQEHGTKTAHRENLTYTEAVRLLLSRERIDFGMRNVLLSHQFYLSGGKQPQTCASELLSIGGLDQVDSAVLEPFDYAALGHLHQAQSVGTSHIRYAGSPLKYSVSESAHQKSITMVLLREKGSAPEITALPITPLCDVRLLRGTLPELLKEGRRSPTEDFVSITLTDEEELFYPREQLQEVYPNLLEVRIDNQRMRHQLELLSQETEKEKEPELLEAFAEFYAQMQGCAMTEQEEALLLQAAGSAARRGEGGPDA